MDSKTIKELENDAEGLAIYEYIANNIDCSEDDMNFLVLNLLRADSTGQFMVSAACYLHAVDAERFRNLIDRLVSGAITADRERRYIGELLTGLYGENYRERVDELNASDDNFRRIYKRKFPIGF